MKISLIFGLIFFTVFSSFSQILEKNTLYIGTPLGIEESLEALRTPIQVNFKEVNIRNISASEGFINSELNGCQVLLTQPAENLVLDFSVGYDVVVNDWLNNNGNASATSISCGDIIWSYNIISDNLSDSDGDDTFDRLTVVIEFIAEGDFGNNATTNATIILNNFASAGGQAGTGSAVCFDSYPVSDIDNQNENEVDYNDQRFTSSTFSIIQDASEFGGPPGLTYEGTTKEIKFPDTGAGQFSYQFDFIVQTSVTIGSEEPITYETSTNYTVFNVGVPFDARIPEEEREIGEDGTIQNLLLCNNGPAPITLSTLYEELQITTGINSDDSFNELYNNADVVNFNPDNYWFNVNGEQITSYQGPGEYVFNPQSFVPECGAIPVTVSVIENQIINEEAQDLVVQYDPNGNDTEIDAWLANNGGAVASGCEDITWEWELIDYQLYTSVNPDDTYLECTIKFTAFDENDNELGNSSASLTYFGFPSAGLSLGFGENLCGDETYDLNAISSVDTSSPPFASSIITITQVQGPGPANTDDEVIVFPDTGAGQFTYRFDYMVSTTLNIAGENLLVEDTTELTVSDLTIPFNPGPDKAVCASNVSSLDDLYDVLEIIDDSEDPNNPPFIPNNYWFNSNGVSITEYSGPGEYIFNAEGFLPQCGGIPATVTVSEESQLSAGTNGTLVILTGATVNEQQLFDALQGSPNSGGVWSPELDGVDTYTYTHSGGPCPDSSAQVVVSEETLSLNSPELLNGIRIYPNPTKDIINLIGDISYINSLRIYSISGQKILFMNNNFEKINVSRIDSGMYFIEIRSDSHSKIIKFFKH